MRNYLAAVLLVAGAVGLNLLLTRLIEPSAAPLLFAAVLLAAFTGGLGPGLTAAALACVADDYFFVAPIGSIDFNVANLVRGAVFLAVSSLTGGLTARLTRAVAERDRSLAAESAAREAAEEAIRVRDRFLSITSHELRGPLSGMSLWADVIAAEPLSDVAREGVDAVRAAVTAQARLIDDLVDVARIANGKLRVDRRPVDVGDVVRTAVVAVRPRATGKGVDLSVSSDDPGPLPVDGDDGRLRQVVDNLLTNAVKFTPEGGRVRVRLDRIGQTARLRVSDTGRGIDPANLPKVFDRFWQAAGPGATAAAAGDGLGLGLTIVNDIVRQHDGHIGVTSDGLGRGATFEVTLPLRPG